ncbi:MAG: heavy metal translocating P-type ATPase [Tepidisphaeraceae bacterium]
MSTLPTNAEPETQACEANFLVQGMDCASCVAHVTKAIRKVPGVQDVAVNLALGRAVVKYAASTPPESIADAATDAGYPTQPEATADAHSHEDHHADSARKWMLRGIVGLILWLPVEVMHWTIGGQHAGHVSWMDWLSLVTSTIGLVLIGGAFYSSAFAALKRRTSNMDTLISLGATVAYGYSLVALVGHLLNVWPLPAALYFNEATALLALISTGHWLEARARNHAGSAIRDLMHLTPAVAWRVPAPKPKDAPKKRFSLSITPSQAAPAAANAEPTQPQEVPVATLAVSDHVLVRPGDRVPIDGVVVDGVSTVDESMLTGEPIPVRRTIGDTVTGGTQNQDGAITVRVTKTGSQTALAQIIKLVETAQNSRPPVQKLADQIAAIFVPTVLAIAAITAIGWFIYGQVAGLPSGVTWAKLAQAVCGVLIVACPCALGLAVPAALMVGTGRGSRLGILFRDISALQSAEKIDTVVFDKTGTLTAGRPSVVGVIPQGNVTREDLLGTAATAEQSSSHPLAAAIVEAARKEGITLAKPSEFINQPGSGLRATIGQETVLVGNAEFVGAAAELTNHHTAVWVSKNGTLLGRIELADELKPDSRLAIDRLHAAALRTTLLTGDHAAAAKAIASQVGIHDVHAGVKPDGKAAVVNDLRKAGRRVAMVGDGINDAPALAAADVGIAIGTGSDIAKETGGIVIVRGTVDAVPTAIALSKATMRVIRQNLFFAFVYNVVAIPLAAFGLLSPIICAAAMAFSDVSVIGNALLLRRRKL